MQKNIFFLLFILLVVATYSGLNYQKEIDIQKYLDDTTQRYTQNYDLIYDDYKKLSNIIFDTKINTKETIAIFKEAYKSSDQEKAKIREELFKHLKDSYRFLKNHNIKQLHFHLPNNDSFLRFHRPSKFGDDLTNIRSTIKFVNDHKTKIDGFEEGRIYNGYRYVFPLFDEDTHIGSVEISFSTLAMTIEMMENFNLIGKFLISKNVVSEKVFKDEKSNYMQSLFEDFLYERKISEVIHIYNKKNLQHAASKKTQSIIKKRAFHNDSFSLYDDKSNSIMTFIKVNNPISNKVVGMLVLRSSAEYIESKQNSFYTLFALSTLLILVLLVFIYKMKNQKELLNLEIKKKTDELNKKNKALQEHEFELELINENLETRVRDEVSKNRDKDRVIAEQSKMVAMGEMIGNIAHHWRQPLSAITTSVTGMMVQKECGILSDDIFSKNCESINENAQYLSKTIDDFRNLLRGDNTEEVFSLKELFASFVALNSKSINEENITLTINMDEDIQINSLPNELNQCITNMYLNARDALKNSLHKKHIVITVSKVGSKVQISFQDNGGGIANNIIDKIFEPYFTTKHQSLGTGLGLHIVYRSIVERMDGLINVENKKFVIDGEEQLGAEFIITLPTRV